MKYSGSSVVTLAHIVYFQNKSVLGFGSMFVSGKGGSSGSRNIWLCERNCSSEMLILTLILTCTLSVMFARGKQLICCIYSVFISS